MTPPKIVVVHTYDGDWVGVYIHGNLVYEGHDIRPEQLLEIINIPHETYEWDDEQAERVGSLPEKFEHVIFNGEEV